MAVTSTVDQVQYTGTGALATYQVPFYFLQSADLLLELQTAAGVAPTPLVLGTDYTVAGAGVLTGGTITLVAGDLASGAVLTIARDPALTQEITFRAQGPIPASGLNNGLDLATMQIQAARTRANNAIQIPLVESLAGLNTTLPPAAVRASTVLGFDASGNVLLVANNGSSTAVTATGSTTPRLLANRFAELFNVMDFGAVGNDVNDDTAAINAACAACVSGGVRGIVYFPKGTYKVTSGLTIDLNWYGVLGERAKIDASSMTTGALFTVKSSYSGSPYYQGDVSIQGLELVGPGSGSSVDGLYYNDATSGAAHLLVQSLNVHAFRYGLNIGNNSYAVSHVQCAFWGCARGIWMGPSLTNAGERLSFYGCDIYNNTLGVKQDFGSGEMFFSQCSIDYNTKQIETTSGVVICTDCHIESDPSVHTSAPFTCNTSGASGLLRFAGCRFVYKSVAGNAGFTSMFDTDNTTGGVVIDNCWYDIGGTVLPSSWIAKKTGVGRYVETNYATNPNTNVLWWPTATSGENLMNDPGFEGAAFPQDLIQIEGDTAAITARITGTNINLTQDATQYHSGAKSLKMQKGAGFNARFAIIVPIRNKGRVFGSIWYTKPGTGAGSFIIGVGYLNMLAMGNAITNPLTYNETDTGSVTIAISGTSAIGWTQQFLNFPVAPANATHAYIFVNANSFTGSDALYFDDLVMTEN